MLRSAFKFWKTLDAVLLDPNETTRRDYRQAFEEYRRLADHRSVPQVIMIWTA